ncbi:hypothetical protein GW915_02275 [bacterium]|nr:hypothetical protein [bacterium]
MRNTILAVAVLALSITGHSQTRSSFGVNLGVGYNSSNGAYGSGSGYGVNLGMSYGQGNGFIGAPSMPYGAGFNSLYGIGSACGYYGGGITGGGGYGPGIPGMGPGPVGPIGPRPLPIPPPFAARPPIAAPRPPMPHPPAYPRPMPFPSGPCIPCGGALANGGIGGGYYAPPPAMYGYAGMGNGGGYGNAGVNINLGGSSLGGNGQLIAALGMGLSAQTTNVFPVQACRNTVVRTTPQPTPVFLGGQRTTNLDPRTGHNPFIN